MDRLRALEPAQEGKAVLVPGDPEAKATAECAKNGYVVYTADHIAAYRKLAGELGVRPMERWQ